MLATTFNSIFSFRYKSEKLTRVHLFCIKNGDKHEAKNLLFNIKKKMKNCKIAIKRESTTHHILNKVVFN